MTRRRILHLASAHWYDHPGSLANELLIQVTDILNKSPGAEVIWLQSSAAEPLRHSNVVQVIQVRTVLTAIVTMEEK